MIFEVFNWNMIVFVLERPVPRGMPTWNRCLAQKKSRLRRGECWRCDFPRLFPMLSIWL